jgi:NADPH:quinone reductase-like Zn-dependent oxidoreductase
MKAIRFSSFGDASAVLEVADLPEPGAPGPGEVQAEVLYSPLNFHDLGFIAGRVAPPALPAVAGNEGIARVLAVGSHVANVSAGDTVVLPLLQGAWRERLLLSADGLAALPDGDLEQFSMLGSNTPTAGLALSEFEPLTDGDWVAQSAGNGGVGRNVIALAGNRGLRTVSIVRRPDVVHDLLSAGADAVVADGPDVVSRIRQVTGDAPIRLAIDGVGGPAARPLLQVLTNGGTLVQYGSTNTGTADQDGQAASRGIRVSRLFVGAFDYASRIAPVISEAIPLVQSGALHVPVAAVHDFTDVRRALEDLRRGGKILLRIRPRDTSEIPAEGRS